ncbi:MAG: flagellar basal-body rod protein FlgB [Planctomycetes bacterium RBG_16_64_10]|nr:MAG: flagellar basal-body rod protein FlgB [Planctomycetes bacterium RBG_16_64_10]
MALPMFASTTIPILEQVVQFTQARHGVLAGNLANLDTPGYRVRDLSPERFEARLRQAVEETRQPTSFSPGDLDFDRFRDVRDSIKSILYHDLSDVSLEQQIMEISKNQMQHNLALAIMTSQFRLLQAAISEQVV